MTIDTSKAKEHYETNGFVVLDKAIPEALLQKYETIWKNEVGEKRDERGLLIGWDKWDAYLEHPEIMDILCHETIHSTFQALGKGVALHSSRTYGTSTTMDWHHDSALNNKIAAENYIGVWVALEDVSTDAGPFELIIGSHNWDMDFAKLYSIGDTPYTGDYGAYDYIVEEIEKRKGQVFRFFAKRGDVLIWHGRLLHRGAVPENKHQTRMSIIGHYCNNYAHKDVTDQPEMIDIFCEMDTSPDRYARWGSGGYYFK